MVLSSFTPLPLKGFKELSEQNFGEYWLNFLTPLPQGRLGNSYVIIQVYTYLIFNSFLTPQALNLSLSLTNKIMAIYFSFN